MKSYAMRKLSASFVVLVMALSALVFVLPGENSGQTTSGANIYVPVTCGGTPVTNAVVNLTDVHTGDVTKLTAAQYVASRTSYVYSNADPAFYRIDVSAPNYFNRQGASSVAFDGLSNVTVNPIPLTPFPEKKFVYNITVVARTGSSIPGGPTANTTLNGATVGFYDNSHRQLVSSGTTASGHVVLTMYNTSSITDVDLVAMYPGFETNATPILVTGNVSGMVIKLNGSLRLEGWAKDYTGSSAADTVAYLLNTNPNVAWIKRVLRTTGSNFAFDAYKGDFTLVVDAPGCNANVTAKHITASVVLGGISLAKQTQRTEKVTMAFETNYSKFLLNVSTVWSYDDSYPGLILGDLGSLRAQVDLALGNGDGTLNQSEIDAFNSTLRTFGTQYVTSADLLDVNQTLFTNATATNFKLGLTEGSVTSTSGVNYYYDCEYTAHGVIPADRSKYVLNATANLNSPSVDYRYKVTLPTRYELVLSATPAGGVVKGYLNVTYDSNVTGTGSELIQLTVEKSTPPIAGAIVDVPSQNASSVMNRTSPPYHLVRYIVLANASVTFIANGSSDPNGNPLTYIWNFTDNTTVVTTMNKSVVHKFANPFTMKKVNLTVRDVAELEDYAVINVTSDGKLPTPVISAKAGKVVAAGGQISVNQSELITFNATYSWDDAVSGGDHQGVIDRFDFNYGEKNVSGPVSWSNPQKNKTYAFPNAGTYVVVLNVTDVVGQHKNTTLTVHVNDTVSPSVRFTVRNDTWGTSLVENKTVHFDANATRDNVDKNNYTLMTYSWSFGDGNGPDSWLNDTVTPATHHYNVTHKYGKIGSFSVTLKVTDLSNNNASSTTVINVASGPRPNLIISKVYFDPQNFTQGKTGYILVNITNSGNAVANDVVVQFYIVPDNGGPLVKIEGTGSLLNGTQGVTTILPGGKVQFKFPYNPSGTGTITIKVNVTSTNQLTPYSYTASGTQALHVKEAPYKALLLWIGVAVVIVAIPSLLYVRSRLMKREKKGPRRERKESKEKESKEKESKEEEEL